MKLDRINTSAVARLFTALLIGASLPANAYFDTVDTADPIAPSTYKLTLGPQFIMTKRSGANFIGRFDAGVTKESSARVLVGFGKIDFQAGAFYKWNPVPDIQGQPAIALMGGLLYASDNVGNELSVRLHPIISKRFKNENGSVAPYASLPIGVTSTDDGTIVPVQVAAGAEFSFAKLASVQFASEVGFNVHKAFTYLSFGVSVFFDESGRIR